MHLPVARLVLEQAGVAGLIAASFSAQPNDARRRELLEMTPLGRATLAQQAPASRPSSSTSGMTDARRRELLNASDLGRAVLREESK